MQSWSAVVLSTKHAAALHCKWPTGKLELHVKVP